jgi:hypothetical protein
VEIEMGWRETRDDGAPLGCVVRLGACSSDQAARAVVERTIGTDEGARW